MIATAEATYFLPLVDEAAEIALDHNKDILGVCKAVVKFWNSLPIPLSHEEAYDLITSQLEWEMERGLKTFQDTADFIVYRYMAMCQCVPGHEHYKAVLARAWEKNAIARSEWEAAHPIVFPMHKQEVSVG